MSRASASLYRTLCSHRTLPEVVTVQKRAMSGESPAAQTKSGSDRKKEVIAQLIFLRRDLGWPAGAMAAQCAHASVAAITEALAADDEKTREYVAPENLPHMTKMVFGVDDLAQLDEVQRAWNKMCLDDLKTAKIGKPQVPGGAGALKSYLWLEQPENTPSALATWPVVRTNRVSKIVKNLKLSYF